jgi:hypothetical protein
MPKDKNWTPPPGWVELPTGEWCAPGYRTYKWHQRSDVLGSVFAPDFDGPGEGAHVVCLPYGELWEPRTPLETDATKGPAHYTEGRTIEPWDAIEDWGLDYCLGCAVKYISRCGRKGDSSDAIRDLEKAVAYLQRKIALLKGKK